MNFWCPRQQSIDFGGDPVNDLAPWVPASGSRNFLNEFFIYYCNSYRQPRIKKLNSRQRFELSECFLVIESSKLVNTAVAVVRTFC